MLKYNKFSKINHTYVNKNISETYVAINDKRESRLATATHSVHKTRFDCYKTVLIVLLIVKFFLPRNYFSRYRMIKAQRMSYAIVIAKPTYFAIMKIESPT